jgi:hypothetical protein
VYCLGVLSWCIVCRRKKILLDDIMELEEEMVKMSLAEKKRKKKSRQFV